MYELEKAIYKCAGFISAGVRYDVQRRLQLLRKSKAHVQRKGYSEHCNVIASVEPEALLKAIALKGEKADIRAIMQSPEVDPALKRALGDVLVTTGDIIGMEGHRSQLRHRGHAAGWHFGSSTLFVTPNLADTRASLLLQLNDKAYALGMDWNAETPDLLVNCWGDTFVTAHCGLCVCPGCVRAPGCCAD